VTRVTPEERLGVYDVRARISLPDAFHHVLALTAADAKELFPSSLGAIGELAMEAHRRWRAYASGDLPLPDGRPMHRWTGKYVDSIKIEVDTNPTDGGLIAYVISSDDPKAYWLEVGTDPWDMRKVLQTSHKVRQTADGTRYLVIPFRWGTPGTLVVGGYVGRAMSVPVHQFMLNRVSESFITGTYQQPSLIDPSVSVDRRRYDWGGSLTPRDLHELGIDPNTAPGRHMVGMYRMNDPEGSHAQHVTFRTISERSPSGTWMHPGTEGKYPARATAEWAEREMNTLMQLAMEADINRLRKQVADAGATVERTESLIR
jgi:hypothetical protein